MEKWGIDLKGNERSFVLNFLKQIVLKTKKDEIKKNKSSYEVDTGVVDDVENSTNHLLSNDQILSAELIQSFRVLNIT